jgi:hypothetical protein
MKKVFLVLIAAAFVAGRSGSLVAGEQSPPKNSAKQAQSSSFTVTTSRASKPGDKDGTTPPSNVKGLRPGQYTARGNRSGK